MEHYYIEMPADKKEDEKKIASAMERSSPRQSMSGFSAEESIFVEKPLGYTQDQDMKRSSNDKQATGEDRKYNNYNIFKKELVEIISNHITRAELDEGMTTLHKDGKAFFEEIKKAFNNEKTQILIISKVLAAGTPGVSDPSSIQGGIGEYWIGYVDKNSDQIDEKVLFAIQKMDVPILQTLYDIYYWLSSDNAEKIVDITLTDSDLHARGVGVCVIRYKVGSDGKEKQIVIKPEDKSFEKAVYGTSDGTDKKSVAETFNELLDQKLLQDVTQKGKIKTLSIKLSEKNAHGSAVEYLNHTMFDQISTENINMDSVNAVFALASLLGLGDLHKENAIYYNQEEAEEKDRYSMGFIDTEVGLNYLIQKEPEFVPIPTEVGLDFLLEQLLEQGSEDTEDGTDHQVQQEPEHRSEKKKIAPLKTAAKLGDMYFDPKYNSVSDDMITSESLWHYDPSLMDTLLTEIGERMRDLSSRNVFIPTPKLYDQRNKFFMNDQKYIDEKLKNSYSQLLDTAKEELEAKGFHVVMNKTEDLAQYAMDDFRYGRIPFFKLDFATGKIYQENLAGMENDKERVICTISVKKQASDQSTNMEEQKDAREAKKSFLDDVIEHNRKVLCST